MINSNPIPEPKPEPVKEEKKIYQLFGQKPEATVIIQFKKLKEVDGRWTKFAEKPVVLQKV